MRSNWRSFIQPDRAIRTNRNGSRRRVIRKSHYRRLCCRQLDFQWNLQDRISGHYELIVPSFRKHSAQMKKIFSALSPEELCGLEVALKKVGKRAAALMDQGAK